MLRVESIRYRLQYLAEICEDKGWCIKNGYTGKDRYLLHDTYTERFSDRDPLIARNKVYCRYQDLLDKCKAGTLYKDDKLKLLLPSTFIYQERGMDIKASLVIDFVIKFEDENAKSKRDIGFIEGEDFETMTIGRETERKLFLTLGIDPGSLTYLDKI